MSDIEWPPPIEESVANWRAENPDAVTCNLSYMNVTADDIKLLAGIQNLRIVGCTQLGDDAIHHLKGIKNLDMTGLDKITDAAFPSLVGIKTLRMSNCNQLTDESIKSLGGIEVLILRVCPKITGATFNHITGVRQLDCSYCPDITDSAIHELKGVKFLTTIACNNLTDDAFKYTEDVTSLDISQCYQPSITDNALSRLVNVQTLILRECNQATLTDNALSGLTNLRRLFITSCTQFTDAIFSPLTELTILDISYCSPGICGPNLQRLRASGTTVDDDDGVCGVVVPGSLSGREQVQGLHLIKVSSFDEDSITEFPRVPVPSVISDIVHGDTDFQTFVIRNFGSGIVLKIKDKYVGISRAYLSGEMEEGSSTFYECTEEFESTFEYSDIKETPFFAIKTPYGSLYVPYGQVLSMLEYGHSFWEVIETDQVLEFTASRSGVLAGGPVASVDHCQAGTTKKVYDAEPFMFEVEEDEEDVPTTLGLKFGETRVEVGYSPTQTLGELRGIIQTKFDLAPDKQRLLYNGRELADDVKTLKELNVQAGFTIAVMKRGGRRTFRNTRKSRKRKPSN